MFVLSGRNLDPNKESQCGNLAERRSPEPGNPDCEASETEAQRQHVGGVYEQVQSTPLLAELGKNTVNLSERCNRFFVNKHCAGLEELTWKSLDHIPSERKHRRLPRIYATNQNEDNTLYRKDVFYSGSVYQLNRNQTELDCDSARRTDHHTAEKLIPVQWTKAKYREWQRTNSTLSNSSQVKQVLTNGSKRTNVLRNVLGILSQMTNFSLFMDPIYFTYALSCTLTMFGKCLHVWTATMVFQNGNDGIPKQYQENPRFFSPTYTILWSSIVQVSWFLSCTCPTASRRLASPTTTELCFWVFWVLPTRWAECCVDGSLTNGTHHWLQFPYGNNLVFFFAILGKTLIFVEKRKFVVCKKKRCTANSLVNRWVSPMYINASALVMTGIVTMVQPEIDNFVLLGFTAFVFGIGVGEIFFLIDICCNFCWWVLRSQQVPVLAIVEMFSLQRFSSPWDPSWWSI